MNADSFSQAEPAVVDAVFVENTNRAGNLAGSL